LHRSSGFWDEVRRITQESVFTTRLSFLRTTGELPKCKLTEHLKNVFSFHTFSISIKKGVEKQIKLGTLKKTPTCGVPIRENSEEKGRGKGLKVVWDA
jgi:hypothetical protein